MATSMKESGGTTRWREKVRAKANVVGTFSYSNGDKYEGEFSEGKKHGKGSFLLHQ